MTEPKEEVQKSPESRGKLTVEAIVTRADGTVEDLGIISEGWVDFEAKEGSSSDPS